MKKLIQLTPLILLFAVGCLQTGCQMGLAAINTTDVTKITTTTTGLRIGMADTSHTPELTVARHQVEYYKVPTGLASTNSHLASDVQLVPSVAGSYEAVVKSALFGNASVTTTVGVGDPGVASIIGGQHQPINAGAAAVTAANGQLYNNPITFGPTTLAQPSSTATNLAIPTTVPAASQPTTK